MKTEIWPTPYLIAGPCAAESSMGVLKAGEEAKKRDIPYVRSSIFKPRTRPGYDGIGPEIGAKWLAANSQINGIVPCSEVGDGHHADLIIEAMSQIRGSKGVLLWIGARNQYHPNQQSIGRAVAGIDWVKVGIKNPIGEDEDHWLGVVDHVTHGGANAEQLIMIHRGFKPGRDGYRNTPNWEMMERVRKSTGLPMTVDTSHMGGAREKVTSLTQWILKEVIEDRMHIDGLMLEVHDFSNQPLTDAGQQLSWGAYDQFIRPLAERWVRVYCQKRIQENSSLLLPV